MTMKNNKANNNRTLSNLPRSHRENKYSIYRLISAVGVLVICGLLVVIAAQYLRQRQIETELAEYERALIEFEVRQAAIEAEIERLQDMDYIEILARERLGLVKPDEVIFQLED